jgi:hypothetical protein
MAAYSELQQREFADEKKGYTAVRHQAEVGTGYFDEVAQAISGGQSSTTALKESTEAAQFHAILAQADRAAAALAQQDGHVGRSSVVAARDALEREHRDLEKITGRLRAARDVRGILAAAEELAAALAGHFEREEREQGMLGLLANGGNRAQLEELKTEHAQILGAIRELAIAGRSGGPQELAGRALAVAQQLERHELREHALATEALGAPAAA